jgi:hypothetical protein
VSDRSGVSRGDRNRNARLPRLREAVPLCNAIAGIDLADSKQMVVVTDTSHGCWRGGRSGGGPGNWGWRWTGPPPGLRRPGSPG